MGTRCQFQTEKHCDKAFTIHAQNCMDLAARCGCVEVRKSSTRGCRRLDFLELISEPSVWFQLFHQFLELCVDCFAVML